MKMAFIAFYLVFTAVLSYAVKPETVHVVVDTSMVFSDEKAIKTARIEILQFARQCALEKVIPPNMSISSLITSMCSENATKVDESLAKSVFINSSLGGYFINEKHSFGEPSIGMNSFTLTINFEADILPRFDMHSQANYIDLSLTDNYVQSGKEMAVKIKSYTGGYIYVFNFLSDNSVILLYPNIAVKDSKILKDQTKELKFSAYKDSRTPTGTTVETIYVVFSTAEIFGWQQFKNNVTSSNIIFSAGEESYQLFQKWLSSTDPINIEEEMVQLHIY